jgi:hypothetical protein
MLLFNGLDIIMNSGFFGLQLEVGTMEGGMPG